LATAKNREAKVETKQWNDIIDIQNNRYVIHNPDGSLSDRLRATKAGGALNRVRLARRPIRQIKLKSQVLRWCHRSPGS